MGFTLSHLGELRDIEGFFQIKPGSFESYKPINIIGVDEIHIKADFIDGSILNGIRQATLYSFILDVPPGQIIYKEPRVKLFKNNKQICSISYNVLFRGQKQ